MLSNTSKYAIRAVIYLALYSSSVKKIGIKVISSELGIPTPFLGKILQMLVRHKILDSSKGPNGGFTLEKPAIDITLMEIIEIIDGADSFDTCVIKTSKCSHDAPCSMHDKIAPLRREMKSLFLTETIADMAIEFRQGNKRIRI
ncbi:MAG: Rrf2 family transcriptional regulator [Bacteroidales bacterium]|nr:Rrf2 family transcriptional regulator [Bacteroidales bacterium]